MVWDRNLNKVYLFLDSERFGFEFLMSGLYFRDNFYLVYDIGLKCDVGILLKGYLRDLMVIGRVVIGEELLNMVGKLNVFFCRFFWLLMLFLIYYLIDFF